jgi:hypothetical protein
MYPRDSHDNLCAWVCDVFRYLEAHTPCHCTTHPARKYDFGKRAKFVKFEMEMSEWL